MVIVRPGSRVREGVAGIEAAFSQIHILDDMIENVSQSAPSLIPLFRSVQQMRLLGILFGGPDTELAIGELVLWP